MVHFRPWLGVAVRLIFFLYPFHGFTYTVVAKCPVFLQKLYCNFRAKQICSGVVFGFPQKWQLRVDDFFLSVSNSLRFPAGLVKATCFPLENLSEKTLLGFCSTAFCLHTCSCSCLILWFPRRLVVLVAL